VRNKYISQQSGLTLIELLAALTISALLIGIIYGALTSSVKSNNKTQSHINLRQEANLIITEMRKRHQEATVNYDICYNQLLSNEMPSRKDLSLENVSINEMTISKTECRAVDYSKDLPVQFTLMDQQNSNEFTIDTVIEKKRNSRSVAVEIEGPDKQDPDFFNYLKMNNVFVYGSDISVFGGALVNKPENTQATIIINNQNRSDLVFSGNNQLSVKNIYIDKSQNEINFNSSAKLGKLGVTGIVSIKGNVNLDNGGAEINGDTIYIDGNVDFGSSGKITGKKVYISGNVTFGNWWAQIIADEIYIGGNVVKQQVQNIVGNLKEFKDISMLVHPNLKIPLFHEDNWYDANGYVSGGKLQDGKKIFANSYTTNEWHPTTKNVVIVSKGDITIGNFGSSTLTGVLFAPNGKVSFTGASFEGMVISKDGFFVGNGGGTVTYRNISEFISSASEFPLE